MALIQHDITTATVSCPITLLKLSIAYLSKHFYKSPILYSNDYDIEDELEALYIVNNR